MRSSMEHMKKIVQIQAQIDSCLVHDDGLLLSSSLAGDAGGQPDPRLVKQAIRLLRVRHRVLQVRNGQTVRHRQQHSVPHDSVADFFLQQSSRAWLVCTRSHRTEKRMNRGTKTTAVYARTYSLEIFSSSTISTSFCLLPLAL